YRCLSRRAAEDRRQNSDVTSVFAHEVDVVLANDRLQRADGRDAGKAQQRAAEQGRSPDLAELFGHVAACAQALTGGHQNSCDLRHMRLQRPLPLPRYFHSANEAIWMSLDEQFFAVQHLLCDPVWLKCVHRGKTPKW